MNNVWILAQAENSEAPSTITSERVTEEETTTTTVATDPDSNGAKPPRKSPFGSYGNLLFLGVMFLLMYMLLFRGPRKKQQQQKQMIQALTKNDKIQTIGGIIGTVVDIKDNEITLKVDESNNTKIKILRSAIGKNMSKD